MKDILAQNYTARIKMCVSFYVKAQCKSSFVFETLHAFNLIDNLLPFEFKSIAPLYAFLSTCRKHLQCSGQARLCVTCETVLHKLTSTRVNNVLSVPGAATEMHRGYMQSDSRCSIHLNYMSIGYCSVTAEQAPCEVHTACICVVSGIFALMQVVSGIFALMHSRVSVCSGSNEGSEIRSAVLTSQVLAMKTMSINVFFFAMELFVKCTLMYFWISLAAVASNPRLFEK